MENDITKNTVTPAAERMRRYRRRRESGQQCITLTVHEYQVWGLVACGSISDKTERQFPMRCAPI